MPTVKIDGARQIVDVEESSTIIIQTVATQAILGAISVDHGGLSGLDDDDHPHYLTVARGDARYVATAHTTDTNNPHATTKTHVGLGNVDNTSDVNKPVSTAQQAALDLKVDLTEVSGDFVGTTDTQPLTNKTLKSSTNDIWANNGVVKVKNVAGSTLYKGQCVHITTYVAGENVERIIKAEKFNSPCHYVLLEDIANNATGLAIFNGFLTGINTLGTAAQNFSDDTGGWTLGDQLYLDANGKFTNTVTTSGFIQSIGEVIRVHATEGAIRIHGLMPFPPGLETAAVDTVFKATGTGTGKWGLPNTHETGWSDMFGDFHAAKLTGSNQPTWTKVKDDGAGSTGVYAYAFSEVVLNELWLAFHIQHDYKIGTAFYPHIHWLPTTANAGVVRWGIEWTAARGHSQEAFGNTSTIYIEQAASGIAYYHQVAEVTDPGITVPNAEPDMLILARVFRDPTHVNDTYGDAVIGLMLDAHYQVDRHATLNKAPNFYV